jgi:hypothetical protein
MCFISIHRLHCLLDDSDNFQRRLFDFSTPLRAVLSSLWTEVREVVLVANDAEGLRNNYFFNPLMEGNQMGLPSERPVSGVV